MKLSMWLQAWILAFTSVLVIPSAFAQRADSVHSIVAWVRHYGRPAHLQASAAIAIGLGTQDVPVQQKAVYEDDSERVLYVFNLAMADGQETIIGMLRNPTELVAWRMDLDGHVTIALRNTGSGSQAVPPASIQDRVDKTIAFFLRIMAARGQK